MFPRHLKNRLSKLGDTPARVSLIHTSPKNKKEPEIFRLLLWGAQWDSNPRPSEPQSDALTS